MSQQSRWRILAGLFVLLSCWPVLGLQAQDRTAIQGAWSTAFTARDHPEWKIEDHLCPLCPAVAHDRLRALLADPANDHRPLQELGQEATRIGNEYRAGRMTEAARERLKQNDAAANIAVIRCEPPDLITLLRAPQPIVIAVRDDHVVIHHDHWNTVRTIAFAAQDAPSPGGPRRLGSSTARFEGSTLVVESRNLLGAISAGITTTEGARVVERWTVSSNRDRLTLELTIDDPSSYREPLVLIQSRVRTPAEKILDLPPCEAISGQL